MAEVALDLTLTSYSVSSTKLAAMSPLLNLIAAIEEVVTTAPVTSTPAAVKREKEAVAAEVEVFPTTSK